MSREMFFENAWYSTILGDAAIDDCFGENGGSLLMAGRVDRCLCRGGTTVIEVARRNRGPFSKGISAVALSSLPFENISCLATMTLLLLRLMMMERDATRFTIEGLDWIRGDCGRSESSSPAFLVLEGVSLGVRRKRV